MFFPILCCALWGNESSIWGMILLPFMDRSSSLGFSLLIWTTSVLWVALSRTTYLATPLTPRRKFSCMSISFLRYTELDNSLHSRVISEEDGGNTYIPNFAHCCIKGMSKVTSVYSGSWVTPIPWHTFIWSVWASRSSYMLVSWDARVETERGWEISSYLWRIFRTERQLYLTPPCDVIVHPVVSSWHILGLWERRKEKAAEGQSLLAFRMKSLNLCSSPKLILEILSVSHVLSTKIVCGKYNRHEAYKIWWGEEIYELNNQINK